MNIRQKTNIIRRSAYIVSDYITTFIAFLAFDVVRYLIVMGDYGFWEGLRHYLCSTKLVYEHIFIPLGLLVVYAVSGYYNILFPKSRLKEFFTTLYSAVFNSILIFLLIVINDPVPKRRTEYFLIFVLFALLLTFTYLGRIIITNTIRNRYIKSGKHYRTLIIGNSSRSRIIKESLVNNTSTINYTVVGFVPIAGENNVDDDSHIFDKSEIDAMCDGDEIDQIVIAPERNNDTVVLEILYDLFSCGVPIRIAPDTLNFITSNIHINDIMASPLIDLSSSKMSEFSTNIKRITDFIISLLVLLILSPLLLIVYLTVKCTSPGPAIYQQERIGRKQNPFKIYKFRSMYIDAEAGGPQLSSENDARITPFGHFMRKYRIDEIPQFFNVLKGDMSIVGPRPEREYYIRQIVKEAPYYTLVHQVRPGITSWGMVKFGYASSLHEMVERTKYDIMYISNMSPLLDVKIMIYTIRTIVKGAGV